MHEAVSRKGEGAQQMLVGEALARLLVGGMHTKLGIQC